MCWDVVLWCGVCMSEIGMSREEEEGYACMSYPIYVETPKLMIFKDRNRTLDLGPRPTILPSSCYDDNQRCEAHTCGGHMLGELHATSETEFIQPERQFISSTNSRWTRCMAELVEDNCS